MRPDQLESGCCTAVNIPLQTLLAASTSTMLLAEVLKGHLRLPVARSCLLGTSRAPTHAHKWQCTQGGPPHFVVRTDFVCSRRPTHPPWG